MLPVNGKVVSTDSVFWSMAMFWPGPLSVEFPGAMISIYLLSIGNQV